MKNVLLPLGLLAFAVSASAADLYFSSAVLNNTNVTLHLSGPTNLTTYIERLNPQYDVWESQGSVTLTNGKGSFTASLYAGSYGFYRTKGTNGTVYYSTNACGVVIGYLSKDYTLLGNIFGNQSITNILPTPFEGTQVQKWNSGSQNYSSYAYDLEFFGGWYPSTPSIGEAEAFWVRNISTNQLKYVVSGIFTTNQVSKTIVPALNLIVSPQYHITDYATWRVDTLNTNQLGGLSSIPLQTTGQNPQGLIYQQLTTAPTYTTYNLTSSNLWQSGGTNVSIHLEITEGFWLDKKGTNNATWSFQRPIW